MSFTGNEPSPKGYGYLARNEEVGVVRKGKNNKKWIVKLRNNGSKYWALHSNGVASENIKIPLMKSQTKSKHNKNIYTIRFCEPFTKGIVENCEWYGSFDFKVDDSFYKVLTKNPSSFRIEGDDLEGNGYIFGSLFPLSEYKLLAQHSNDVAATGLVDVSNITKQELELIPENKEYYRIVDLIHKKKQYDRFDDRNLLKVIQEKISDKIIFVGETFAGDIGANLYVHYKEKKQIDGLIITCGLLTL
ncbi:hypothetical protein [Candidatus Berkiella aquae]|uniref:Uncharacterized protein n=1 Tax=Candidatus Berkiella aquae TaxID=295108 RepID=A0A0Q9Z054_9GAMM|nr:hypothetical protein [Candidatus Berkiella aquae]MCS5711997.1 hypothetical protein [Candidatus Berkiella aquae]